MRKLTPSHGGVFTIMTTPTVVRVLRIYSLLYDEPDLRLGLDYVKGFHGTDREKYLDGVLC